MKLWTTADIYVQMPLALKLAFGIMEAGCVIVGMVIAGMVVVGILDCAAVATLFLCLMVGVLSGLKGGSARLRLTPLQVGVTGLLMISSRGFACASEMSLFTIMQYTLVLVSALLHFPSSGRWFAQASALREPPRTRIARFLDRAITCGLVAFVVLASSIAFLPLCHRSVVCH